ncbi:MAG TPA: hypothetical protein VE691_02925 [Rubrobacter sp.]|nr:hypothetical protein [Rubrobacter sp.]
MRRNDSFSAMPATSSRKIISQEEWDFWNSDDARAKVPIFMVDLGGSLSYHRIVIVTFGRR